MIDQARPGELTEVRPGPASLLRHAGADHDLTWARGVPRIVLRSGAVWVRATTDGPGLVVTCGASHVHVRDGAAVVEVRARDALVVVATGRVGVSGSWPLARPVPAGHGVTATHDGTVRTPRPLPAAEMAANPMLVENLLRDGLASGVPGVLAAARPEPTPHPPVDGAPPVLDLTDGALASVAPHDPVVGPDARPGLVLRAEGGVAVRTRPSALEEAVASVARGASADSAVAASPDQLALAAALGPRRAAGAAP